MPKLPKLFADLSRNLKVLSKAEFEQIERFTILPYQKTSELSSVNEARKQMFSHNRKIENVPPTAKALEEHVKRATYTAGFIWGKTLQADPIAPSPEHWGWTKDPKSSSLTPKWTTLLEASKACKELTKCRCKSRCIKQWCKCVQAGLPCSRWCDYLGQCNQSR